MAYPLNMRSLDILFALLFTGVVIFQFMYVQRDNERLFRSLHAIEAKAPMEEHFVPRAPPSTYLSLDWLVHPKHNHDSSMFFMSINTEKGSCYSSGMSWTKADCGPEYWQRYVCLHALAACICCVSACACCVFCMSDTHTTTKNTRSEDFCPNARNGPTVGDYEDDLVRYTKARGLIVVGDTVNPKGKLSEMSLNVLSHIYEKDADMHKKASRGVVPGSTITEPSYWWKNKHMADVCRIERIGDMKLFINDDSTWGIASGHSSSVLVLGAALIMWMANISDIVYNPTYRQSDLTKYVRRFKWLLLGGSLFVIVLARVMSVTELVVDSTVMTRVLPNGSYYYVALFVAVSGYIFVNKTKRLDAGEQAETAEIAEYEPLTDKLQDGINGPIKGVPAAGLVETNTTPPMSQGLNVSGFQGQRVQLSAFLPRGASGNAKAGETPVLAEELYNKERGLTYASFASRTFNLQSSHFAVAQAFTLPLLTLGAFMFNTNYDTDSNFQVLFWAIGAYGLLDVVVHRLGQALKIYEDLVRAGSVKAQMDEVVGLGKIIDLVALVLQSLIAFLVFVSMRWHLSLGSRTRVPVLGQDHMSERFLDIIPVLYITYFTLCNFTKTCVLLVMVPSESRKHSALVYYDMYVRWVADRSEAVLFVLLNVFVLSVTLYMSMDMRENEYIKPFPLITSPAVKPLVEHLVRKYRSGWTDI